MKLALLGDIHGNHLALATVLASARKHGAERLLITGDLVGYYFWSSEVMEMLLPWDMVVVRGNHEDMLAEAQRRPESLALVEKKYGAGLQTALKTLTPDQLQWLENLPHPMEIEIDSRSILLCHGSPWDVDHYIYPDAADGLLNRCAETGHDWVVLGHTHYPMERKCGETVIVNPGSVGQPRNRQPGAQWALLDTATRRIEQYCEDYDMKWIADQCQSIQPDMPFLWKVLSRV